MPKQENKEKKLLSYKDILPQLKEIKKEIAKILGTNDFELIVFGSYARGEAREDSDLDLLLLTKEKIDWRKELTILKKIGEKTNFQFLFDLTIMPKQEFNEKTIVNIFFVRNINQEGVKI
jgi:predicted nucleotidyltransferase